MTTATVNTVACAICQTCLWTRFYSTGISEAVQAHADGKQHTVKIYTTTTTEVVGT
jgi:hypothetical protein